ncbi:hypothetical protein B5M06_10805 [Comamonas kerstersii]|uniref:Uncharacterized protein n=1 Tax=Comamonas kerstersii TaxID=225992 RepID=A0A1V0BFC6_9BURK|nr:hypothetical protein [Comamonas kerstersii]AQZ98663.1 hypothetical protein B5M06_10805 [Comamonas kerstersii]
MFTWVRNIQKELAHHKAQQAPESKGVEHGMQGAVQRCKAVLSRWGDGFTCTIHACHRQKMQTYFEGLRNGSLL